MTRAHSPAPADDTPPRGTPVDPQLLRLIQRVAHREHLLVGTVNIDPVDIDPAPRTRTTAPRSPARHRPAIGSARTFAARATRGTTARKVTWS